MGRLVLGSTGGLARELVLVYPGAANLVVRIGVEKLDLEGGGVRED